MTTYPSSNVTRASLIERAKKADADAWREIVELYGPLIAYWSRRCGRDEHAAADCVQDVFASVSEALPTFEFRGCNGAFRGWLWTITRNKLRDASKRKTFEQPALGGSSAYQQMQAIIDTSNVPDDEPSEPTEIRKLVVRALRQIQNDFAPQTWQAFWRSAIDQLPTASIADELSMSQAAIRQARSRVLRRLREQLGDLNP